MNSTGSGSNSGFPPRLPNQSNIYRWSHFKNTGVRSNLSGDTLQRRLLLCLYGLGSNTGLKRVCAGIDGDKENDLRYIKKHYIHREHLRNAIASVVNAIFGIRKSAIWGEGTTTCASDSKKFGSWDQNLMTEWHIRARWSGGDDLLAC